MLEIDLAKNGHRILRKNGRLLASSVDPIREAQVWADHVCSIIEPHELIIVLGLGCGYHIEELQTRRPQNQLFVIDSDPELLSQVHMICPKVSMVNVLIEANWNELIGSQTFRDAIGGVYRIVKHGPSCQIDEEYFKCVEGLLLGREKISFLYLMKTRPELLSILDPEKITQIMEQPDNEAISIKTLSQMFASNSMVRRERRIWRVLEELVK